MPRPPKHVSPGTLGGRIRAARERLQLSLADVAEGHYSTSLISQIERNRADPSHESLRFLAERLQLPFEDLETLAQQHRAAESEPRDCKTYEELRVEATQLLNDKKFYDALTLLNTIPLSQAPAQLRWRLVALRGHAYFEQRKFMKAQQDFLYALDEDFDHEHLPIDQQQELLLLHLHLAETHRALQQNEEALDEYAITLQMINCETPAGYAAEANWGMSLVVMEANKKYTTSDASTKCWDLRKALEHAENARFLYRSIGEQLRAAAVTCQVAHIEQMLGNVERARTYLEEVLSTWSSDAQSSSFLTDKHRLREEANVISAAACALAGIELEAKNFPAARSYVNQALEASHKSYKLRRADAYVMLGRILEAINPDDSAVAESFRCATQELADTHRIAARISAHVRLGHHLLRIGKIAEGEEELEKAHYLSTLVSSGPTISGEDSTLF